MIKLLGGFLIPLFAWLGFQFSLENNDKPDDNRFTQVTLATGLDEPMEMACLPNEKVILVERKGAVKIIDEKTKEVSEAGFIEVNTKYTNKAGHVREAEEGLMGISLDPNFASNHWIYLYYADPIVNRHVLSRFVLEDDVINMESEKQILEVKTQREECCHTGGGMTWDAAGNLYLTVGNNTVNPRSGASNLNEAPGKENEDDQRAPGNSNDLRGKILRIHPENDGTYTIPEGNLFPKGTAKTRPEIYTMGHRNAWRPTLDSKTGYLYWGEVGPDASKDSVWGPMGYDEFNQAKKAGFFGWPYFIGNNYPYNHFNSADGTYGAAFDVNNVVNNSVNNTGINNLPKPVPAFIWYPYGPSPDFPMVGTGGRSATGGPVFRADDFKNAARPWPAYFEGKWLITEFMRGWIMAVSMDQNGDYVSMERIFPDWNFSSAIDMDFGPSGDLYVLEYGAAWFRGNENSRLVKIEYNAGNRKPMVSANADVKSGSLPLNVKLNGEGKDYDDYDQGQLKYTWVIRNAKKKTIANLAGKDVNYIFKKPGNYTAELIVSDTKGDKNAQTINITAGNEAPQVSLKLDAPNQTFYFSDAPIAYNILVKDKEDGTTADRIKAEEVAVTFDFLPDGFDPIAMAANQKGAEDMASYAAGRNLIEASDCKSCHQYNTPSIGPSYVAVAEKYSPSEKNMNYLVKKIKEGGSGVWGEHGMSGHPSLSDVNAKRMVDYIFSFSKNNANTAQLGLSGKVSPQRPAYESANGKYVLRAYYKDKGASKTVSLPSEELVLLRPNFVSPKEVDYTKSVQVINTAGHSFSLVGDNSYAGYKSIDLSAIKKIQVYLQSGPRSSGGGAAIEIRLDSPTGKVIGVSEFMKPEPLGFGRPPQGVSFAEWSRSRSAKTAISLTEEINGKHDVYFVFKNKNAKPTDVLIQLSEIEFML